jgi:hypothetical protein
MHVHNCQRCNALCASVHPWCLFCRADQSARVASLAMAAERDGEVSPVIVRQIDATVARINRREAQAKRRTRISGLVQLWAARVLLSIAVGFVLIRLVIALGDLIVRAL